MGRPGRTLPIVVAAGLLLLNGCAVEDTASAPTPAASPASTVPAEFRAACGKPGSEVVTARLSVVITHRDCDLTGVVIVNQGRGVTVPPSGGVSAPGITVDVAGSTRDVTFTAEAEVGNQ